MKSLFAPLAATALMSQALAASAADLPAQLSRPRITVASYDFGNYHPGDPRKREKWGHRFR